jgi:hypothetical protein
MAETHHPYPGPLPLERAKTSNKSGGVNLTLDCTDVYSGRASLFGLLNKAQKWAFQSLAPLSQSLPFPRMVFPSIDTCRPQGFFGFYSITKK